MLENMKEKVIDELNKRIGQTHYLCDLGMTLTIPATICIFTFC